MDHLWSPWRYQYVTSKAAPQGGCVFCDKCQSLDDEANLVLYRGEYNFAILNLYPYSTGHLMICPYEHVDSLAAVTEPAAQEMMTLARQFESVLRRVYNAPGINLGMNLGACAGAGVAGHIHLHILPRWPGDANFLTVIGETRVHVEDLPISWSRIREGLREQGLLKR